MAADELLDDGEGRARLRDRLRLVPGVADARVEDAVDAPANVKVRLSDLADADAVGREVQEVLAEFGIRSRVAGAGEVPELRQPTPSPQATEFAESELPDAEAGDLGEFVADPVPSPPPSPRRDPAGGSAGLAAVSVEETPDGVTVVARSDDGRRFSRRAEADRESVAAAIVAAVGALAEGGAVRLLAFDRGETDSARWVSVVVETGDGRVAAGASIVKAGVPYALGRATWSALRD